MVFFMGLLSSGVSPFAYLAVQFGLFEIDTCRIQLNVLLFGMLQQTVVISSRPFEAVRSVLSRNHR